jgi:hypothetical protein
MSFYGTIPYYLELFSPPRANYEEGEYGMTDPDSILQLGIEAAREGNNDEARSLFRLLTREDPNNVQGWFWLAGVADSREERQTALERVLELEPGNELALQSLQAMGARPGGSDVSAGESASDSHAPESAAPAAATSSPSDTDEDDPFAELDDLSDVFNESPSAVRQSAAGMEADKGESIAASDDTADTRSDAFSRSEPEMYNKNEEDMSASDSNPTNSTLRFILYSVAVAAVLVLLIVVGVRLFSGDDPQTAQEDTSQVEEGAAPEGGEGAAPEGGEGAAPEGGEGAAPEGGEGAAPEGGEGAAPEGGEGAAPEGGEGAAPEGGEGAAPEGGEGAAPEGGEGAAPEGGEGAAPEGGEGTAPEGGEGAAPEGGEGAAPEGGEGAAPEAEPTAAPTEAPAAPADAASANPAVVPPNTPLQSNNWTYNFATNAYATYISGASGGLQPQQGRTVIVLIQVSNNTGQAQPVPQDFFVLKDAQGRVYEPQPAASSIYINQYGGAGIAADLSHEQPVPANDLTYSVPLVFDVPPDATDLVLFARSNPDQGWLVLQDVQ